MVDVLDGNLREVRVEGSACGNAVDRHEERVELLQAPHRDVRKARAAVRAARGIDAHDVLQRVLQRPRAGPTQLLARDDFDGTRHVHLVLGNFRARDDHLGRRRWRRDAWSLGFGGGSKSRGRGNEEDANVFHRTMLTKLRA